MIESLLQSNPSNSAFFDPNNNITGRRYPSPLVKQDLAKLGKDGETRRAAMASLKTIIEEHLHSSSGAGDSNSSSSNNVARFLQQVEESREGRRHVVAIVEMLARARGPALAPHIPRLMHLLVQHGLLASAGSPALLPACASCVCTIAASMSGRGEKEAECAAAGTRAGCTESAESVLRQVCLPLMSLLPNKIPPLASGAAACLKSLVDGPTWRRSAPQALAQELCYKAAAAAAASPPTQTTLSHLLLLRSLASANPSSISVLAPPLIRLSITLSLPHPFSPSAAAAATWQLRLAAIHLLEALLVKASDHSLLSAHLAPSLAALEKCRRHDKLPQLRNAVIHSLHTLQTLKEQHSLISRTTVAPASAVSHSCQATPGNPSTKSCDAPSPYKDRILKLNRAHTTLGPSPEKAQVSIDSPLLHSRKMQNQNVSLVVEPPVEASAVPEVKPHIPGINESEFFSSYFGEVDNIHQHHLEDDDTVNVLNPCPSLTSSNTGTSSQIRQRKVVHHISEGHNMANSSNLEVNSVISTCEQPPPPSSVTTVLSKIPREIRVLRSNDELLATCGKIRHAADNTMMSTTCTHTEKPPLTMIKHQQHVDGSHTSSTKSGSLDQNISCLNIVNVSNHTVRGQSAEAHFNADDGERVCSPKLILDSDRQIGKYDSVSPHMKPSNSTGHRSGSNISDSRDRNCRNTNGSNEDGDVIAVNYTKNVDANNKVDSLCGDSTLFHFNLDATTLHHEDSTFTDVQDNHGKMVLALGSKAMSDEEASSMMSTDLTMAHEHTSSETETSSGEWSVRDNPIAEDHVISMSEESTSCNQRSSKLLHALRWSMPQIPCIDFSKECHDQARRLAELNRIQKEEMNLEAIITCREELLEAIGDNNALNLPSTADPFISNEFSWIEIEELSPIQENDNLLVASSCELPYYIPQKTKSISHRMVNKELKPSKALVCFGLFFPIAITILSRCSLRNDDIGHFLPPT